MTDTAHVESPSMVMMLTHQLKRSFHGHKWQACPPLNVCSPWPENCFPFLLGTVSTRELFPFYVGAGRLLPPKNLFPSLFNLQ